MGRVLLCRGPLVVLDLFCLILYILIAIRLVSVIWQYYPLGCALIVLGVLPAPFRRR